MQRQAVRHLQRASFWRGGTSNGVMIAGQDLTEWKQIKLSYSANRTDLKEFARILQPLYRLIMGSPDPYGRQLNGMGGGLSSLSKAVIVDSSDAKGCDLDYLFIQTGIKDGVLDLAGNCGNMSSAVAPFALDKQLFDAQKFFETQPTTATYSNPLRKFITARIRNINTSKIVDAKFLAAHDPEGSISYEAQGEYVLDGVADHASPITLSFMSPGGAKTGRALPTRNPTDTVEYAPGKTIQASLTDISNPGVFIDGREIGWNLDSTPEQLNADKGMMLKLEAIRRRGAEMMGMDPETPSIPKIVMLYPPPSDDVDIACQALSMEQAHKAVPMTLGLNLGVACKIEGTIAHSLARHQDAERTIIRHPSGKVEVGAKIKSDGSIESAQVLRTARMLMDGYVNVTPTARFPSPTA